MRKASLSLKTLFAMALLVLPLSAVAVDFTGTSEAGPNSLDRNLDLMDGTGKSASGATEATDDGASAQGGSPCADYQERIHNSCSGNPNLNNLEMPSGDALKGGVGGNSGQAYQTGLATQSKLQSVKSTCDGTYRACQEICRREANHHRSLGSQHTEMARQYEAAMVQANGVLGGQAAAARYQAEATREHGLASEQWTLYENALSVQSTCEQEHKTTSASVGGNLATIAQFLLGAAAIWASLKNADAGSGPGGGPSDFEPAGGGGGICEAPGSEHHVDCGGGDPNSGSSRSRLSGATGLGSGGGMYGLKDRPSAAGSDLNGAAGANTASADGGYRGDGGGGLPGIDGGAPGAGDIPVEGDGEGDEDSGPSGFLSGGSGGGASAAGGVKPYAFKPAGFGKKAKGKGKLGLKGKGKKGKGKNKGQAAAAGNRSPAGKGGPFQDNFTVIKQSYKEATPSLTRGA